MSYVIAALIGFTFGWVYADQIDIWWTDLKKRIKKK